MIRSVLYKTLRTLAQQQACQCGKLVFWMRNCLECLWDQNAGQKKERNQGVYIRAGVVTNITHAAAHGRGRVTF